MLYRSRLGLQPVSLQTSPLVQTHLWNLPVQRRKMRIHHPGHHPMPAVLANQVLNQVLNPALLPNPVLHVPGPRVHQHRHLLPSLTHKTRKGPTKSKDADKQVQDLLKKVAEQQEIVCRPKSALCCSRLTMQCPTNPLGVPG